MVTLLKSLSKLPILSRLGKRSVPVKPVKVTSPISKGKKLGKTPVGSYIGVKVCFSQ